MWPAIGRFGCKFFLQGKKRRIIIIHGWVACVCSQETTEAEDYDRATNPNGEEEDYDRATNPNGEEERTYVRAKTYRNFTPFQTDLNPVA
jgi:hypothetical protein